MSHIALRLAVVVVCLLLVAPAEAQLNTQHVKGTVGLKSGSQPPPGVYFIAPLHYVYTTDEVKDQDGDTVPPVEQLTSHAYGGGINVVTRKTLFGGVYGFRVLFPVGANNRIQGTEIDANPGAGAPSSCRPDGTPMARPTIPASACGAMTCRSARLCT